MIPMHFGYAYWEAATDPEPVVIVPIHGHCWIDHSHVITLNVAKKTRDDEVLFTCPKCEVREKSVRCRKRKCLQPVSV